MEMRRRWWCMCSLVILMAMKAQADNVAVGCSSTPAKNTSEFSNTIDALFSDLRIQLTGKRRYATAERNSTALSDPLYALVQCRNYLSPTDCSACYDVLVSYLHNNCSSKNVTGARAVSNGCFLRYEGYEFYQRTSDNWAECGNESTVEMKAAFSRGGGERLLTDLKDATPRIKGDEPYFAAIKRKVKAESGASSTLYGVTQCGLNVTAEGCRGCLTSAIQSLKDACLHYASEGRVSDAACFMRYSNASFFLDNQTTNIKPFLDDLRRGINEKAVIGGSVGGAALVVIVATVFIWYKFSRQLKAALIANILGATELQLPNRYSYNDLKAATNNFSEDNRLGRGAFGAVYKAMLRNGNVVAVKKLDMKYSRVKEDFESEVRLISNVHHRNLVRLLGCCRKGSELLLIYEYMENKSLEGFLYGANRGKLRWKQRLEIIFGTARGIAYLHEDYHTTIIHRDIKPGNILLDNQFQPKIADLGLAKLLPQNQSHLSTKFAGTLGYTAPEYAIQGHLSEKVDVYSFGIVILEIVSGRKCNDMDPDSTTDYLVRELYERDMHQNLADVALKSDEYEVEELKKIIEIAMMCVQSTPSSRPTMSQLIYMMSSPSFSDDFAENALLQLPNVSQATASISHFTGR